MQVYKPPVDDIMFVLEAFGYDELLELDQFKDFDRDTVRAIIDELGRFCVKEFLPLNAVGDQVGLEYDPETGDVTTPPGFVKAYKKFVASGLLGLAHPAEHGGAGAPAVLGLLAGEFITAANKSLSMCPGLSHGLIEALHHYGTPAQKDAYLGKLISGEWTGTMCLTESQCGTDLGLLSTKAIPAGDHFKLTGTKIWISFGEHDMAENILHLVLARLPDAPPGIKGISSFVVPKLLPDGSRNGVKCTGLEHKMGIQASPTCVISMEDAVGHLVGAPHKGMRAMFVMMNAARLSVGIEGYALGEIAYQTAVEFCKERRQMRAVNPSRREHDQEADVILVHPDVRRLLARIRSSNEGMRGLVAYAGKQLDLSLNHPDEGVRERSGDLVALLTPVVKGYCTEQGFLNTSDAVQVTGGAGYTRDWPLEQYMRDERIAMIYEGTNHIQALDLVGRKLPRDNGRLVRRWAKEVQATLAACQGHEELAPFAEGLAKVAGQLTEVTMSIAMKGMKDPEEAAAVASRYLSLFGLCATAMAWCRMAEACVGREGRFYRTKLKLGRFWMAHFLPEADTHVRVIAAGKEHMMAFDQDEF